MKAIQIQDGFGLDNLRLVDRPEPQPGVGQVLLKLKAASLNRRDLMVVQGRYYPRQPLPLIPLSDGVGEVVAVGEGVTRVKVGDRVSSIFFQTWLAGRPSKTAFRSALGSPGDGVLAEYVVLHQDGVLPVPEHLTDEEGATLPCAAVTAWNALIAGGGLKAGDTVLLQGTGGVSLFALQFAKLTGARIIITSSSDEKLERALQMGASDRINYKTTPNWEEQVYALTDGNGVDYVVEVGGAGTLPQSLRAVRVGGHISLIGVLTAGEGINPLPILSRSVRVQGVYVGSREMFEAMNRAIVLHQLKPVVDRSFPFTEARQALEYLESGAHFGKICLKF
jgi:NADPH:quinone reductase-like Zn-dependent oxidoreductase